MSPSSCKEPADPLTNNGAHATAHPRKIEDTQSNCTAFEQTCTCDDGVVTFGLLPKIFKAVVIRATIVEFKRV